MTLELTSSKSARTVSSRSRKSTANADTGKDISIDNVKQELSWTEKYHPKRLADLLVHNSKVKAFREWLQKALEVHNCYFDLGMGNGSPCVLAICGNSGCCKTSTVEIVCAEEGVEIISWTENMWESDAIIRNPLIEQGYHYTHTGYNNTYVDKYSMYSTLNSSAGYSTTARDLFRIDGVTKGAYTTKVESLVEFARHSQYPSLNLQSHTTTNNTTHFNDKNNSKYKYKPTNTTSSSTYEQPSPTGNISSEITHFQRKIILIRDPPGFSNNSEYSSSSSRVQGMYEFILSCSCPVVLVVSSVSGRDDLQYTVDRCLPYSVKQRVQFESLYFPPITELKATKALLQILKAEGGNKREQCEDSAWRGVIQEIATTCMGDIRHAVLQLQLLVAAPAVKKSGDTTGSGCSKDRYGGTSSGSRGRRQLQRALSAPASNNTTTTPLSTMHQRTHSDNILQHHEAASDHATNSIVPIIDLTQESPSEFREHPQVYLEVEEEEDGLGVIQRQPTKRVKRSRQKRIESDEEEEVQIVIHRDVFSIDPLIPSPVRTVPYNSVDTTTTTTTTTPTTTASMSAHTGSELPVVGRRDSSYSSLRSVNKLLGATLDMKGAVSFDPDSVIERSELASDLLLAFMQWNVVASLQATPRLDRCAEHQLPLSETEVSLQEITEMQRALHLLSEVDIYTNQQYNPNIQYDRFHTSSYPLGYITSILSRSIAASRGIGRTEEVDVAKSKGFRKTFQGVYRPKVLNLRTQQSSIHHRLTTIQQDLLEHSTSTSAGQDIVRTPPSHPYNNTKPGSNTNTHSSSPSTLWSSHTELLLNTIPYFKNIIYIMRQDSNVTTGTTPIYSERIDWLIEHIYSHNNETPTIGSSINTSAVGRDMGNTQQQYRVDELDDEIDEFE